jgi:two-component system alkaline phosphatase synthesis response regulator PhoP
MPSAGWEHRMKNVLVVEDDSAMAIALRDGLEYEGYAVSLANDGEVGLQMASDSPPDLILLDVMLPKLSGLSLCRELRHRGRDMPIIMLTARGQELDKVQGLKAGADDYLTKPFGFLELAARIEAVLRRSASVEARKYAFGPVTVDFRRREADRAGERVALSAREFELLAYLIQHRGEVLTRQQLLEAVWGYHGGSNTRTVDMHVAKLRKKLEDDPARPHWIVTQHRVGYRFDG